MLIKKAALYTVIIPDQYPNATNKHAPMVFLCVCLWGGGAGKGKGKGASLI